MIPLPGDLNDALDSLLAGFSQRELTRAVERLVGRYRGGVAGPVMRSPVDVAAYAAYRMPATYAAASAAMRQAALAAPGFLPRTLADAGGGTGAAAWAATGIWPGIEAIEITERDPAVIAAGRRLAAGAGSAALRGASWHRADLASASGHTEIASGTRQSGVASTSRHTGIASASRRSDIASASRRAEVAASGPRPAAGACAAAPAADLVTMAYVLGELPPDARDRAIRRFAAGAGTVVVVEPGTPAGHARITAARDTLLALGMTTLAPCPHDAACPIVPGRDWCHFSVRLPRTPLHRRIKRASLGFEDEKFSYVVASRERRIPVGDRIVRHPAKRDGMVRLRLCVGDGDLRDEIVSRRDRNAYRAARDAAWGDPWP
ncbi:small ribosomal subunit Rsm22 family protein [Microbispora corallina]|uniref:rRNA methyltransferase n=1 Tax=Microbispora corallina TaxID=83302 RepID=A0ABQ4G6X5_9ACTN|nr:small ribosomal subunit Rsm22 family protein [Microbispora corallina]GIH42842.1 rRNA methyltransferase [Microbispora corallina]